MSIFGKIFKGAKSKINIKGLVSGIGAQSTIGGTTTTGGISSLFGSLFGKKKAKEAEVIAQAQVVQAKDQTLLYVALAAIAGMFIYILTRKK
jgi:hypothetical protein